MASQGDYARSRDNPNTQYFQFKPVREAKGGLNSESLVDADTGESPISRWLAFEFDYDDFVSNPDAVGNVVRCQVPLNSIVMEALVRVDEVFVGTGHDDIDIGDGNDTAGWADAFDFSATGIYRDANAAYNDPTSDPSDGTAGYQFYDSGDTIDILFKNATAPTAGKAILFLRTISYHEDLEAEW